MDKKLISIVTPVYNEEETFPEYKKKITQFINSMPEYNFEIVITDNHSTDNTCSLLKEAANQDSRFYIVRLLKNYGYQKSIYTAFQYTNGDAVVEVDADLEDSPFLIRKFIKQWEAGYKLVYGIRKQRKEPKIKTLGRSLFYYIISSISTSPLPMHAGDFMLMDRLIIDKLLDIKEFNIYIRGVVHSFGFKSVGIPYNRDARISGKSKFNFIQNMVMGMDAFINQGTNILRIILILVFIYLISTFFLLIFILVLKYIFFTVPNGFSMILFFNAFSFGISLGVLSLIGQYVIRIYQVVNNYSLTITEQIYTKQKNSNTHYNRKKAKGQTTKKLK